MDPLKLVALDAEDLNIISAHVQDAVMKVGELEFLPRDKRFVIPMNRFAWETVSGFLRKHGERRQSFLHFDRVLSVKAAGIDHKSRPKCCRCSRSALPRREPPAGTIELDFSGDVTIRLDVECVEARLADLGGAWEASSLPSHKLKRFDGNHAQSGRSGFRTTVPAFLGTKREASPEVDAPSGRSSRTSRQRGDAVLKELTLKFDRANLDRIGMAVTLDDIAAAYAAVDKQTVEALKFARDRIEAHHKRQMPKDDRYIDPIGVELGSRWTAIEAVGLYVPGGLASYPSSVLMNAVPARVAGVRRMAMVVPPTGGEIDPLVLVAADLAGISEIYRLGGAQAIAALAYGTETIKPVAKIVGPGNAYVAAAKRQVFGTVGIDMIAGPSEVLVVADKDNDPEWLAADLLAQAEHGMGAQSILITDDEEFAHRSKSRSKASSKPCRRPSSLRKAGANSAR